MKSGRLSVSQTGSRSSSIGHSNCAVNPRNLTDDSMVLLDEEGEEGVLVAECKVGKEEREEARDGTMDINAVREVEECQEEARDLYMDTITPGPKRKLADAMGASATPIPTPTRGGSGAASAGRIKTVLRVRPVETDQLSLRVNNASTVQTTDPKMESRVGDKVFTFARVMDEFASQEEVFCETAKPLVAGLFKAPSSNGLVVAYGATNAGKTHTVVGTPGNDGILQRTLADVFQRLKAAPLDCGPNVGGGAKLSLRVNFRVMEIYGNKVYDLLRHEGARVESLSIVNSTGEVEGLSNHFPADLTEALKLVRQARSRSTITGTALNGQSSRGHTFWTIELQEDEGGVRADEVDSSSPKTTRPVFCSPKLWLVDLAGSENMKRAESNAGEAANINMDISTLFKCLKQAQQSAQLFNSFRDRKLTQMLKPMLVRAARQSYLSAAPCTSHVLLVNVNPAKSEYCETQKVLKNTIISKKAEIFSEKSRTCGCATPDLYLSNGHLNTKRQKPNHCHHHPGADSPAVWKGSSTLRKSKLKGPMLDENSVCVFQTSGRKYDHNMITKGQDRDVSRLEDEIFELEGQLSERYLRGWDEGQEELHILIENLEADLAKAQRTIGHLRMQLVSKDSSGANVDAIIAQSARNKAEKNQNNLRLQHRDNTREAEEEAIRGQKKAEEALIERDAKASQNGLLQQELDESRAREKQFKADAARALTFFYAEKNDEASRAASLLDEGKAQEASLQQELNESREEARQIKANAAQVLAAFLAEKDAEAIQAASLLDEGKAQEGALRQKLDESRSKADRLENDVTRLGATLAAESTRASDLEAGNARLQVVIAEAETRRVEMNNSTASYPDDSDMNVDGRGDSWCSTYSTVRKESLSVTDSLDESGSIHCTAGDSRVKNPLLVRDTSEETAPRIFKYASADSDKEKKEKGASKRRLRLRNRKILGNLQPTRVIRVKVLSTKPVLAVSSAKIKSWFKDAEKEKTLPLPKRDDLLEVEAELSLKAAAAQVDRKERVRDKREQEKRAAKSREETRRCEAARKESMLSKPSPAKAAEKRVVRRSNRLKG